MESPRSFLLSSIDHPVRYRTGHFKIGCVTVINPMHGRRPHVDIEIFSGYISSISDPTTAAQSMGEFSGCFVLPGLIDMHVHLPPDSALNLTRHAALSYLVHGVTSIRDAGDLDGMAVDAARRLAREDVHPVPRVFSCGPFVGSGKPTFRNTISLLDESEISAEEAALRVKGTGANFMKFYDGLTKPMINSLKRACIKHNLEPMGHVPSALAYEDAGITDVQHFFGVPHPQTRERDTPINRSCDWHAVDERRMDEIVETSIAQHIANTPTIVTNKALLNYRDFTTNADRMNDLLVPPLYLDVVWHPERGRLNNRLPPEYLSRQVDPAIAKKQRLVKKLFDASAKIFLGTDVVQPFIVPGASLYDEIALFVDAGIGLEDVWKLATRDAGERLGMPKLGCIEVGAPADILLFRRDPTNDFANIKTLDAVIVGGNLYRISDLRKVIKANYAYLSSPAVRRMANRSAEKSFNRVLSPV